MKSVTSSVAFGALAVSSVAAYRGIPLSHALPKEPRSDSTLKVAAECAKSCVTSSNCYGSSLDLEDCVLDRCEDEDEFDGIGYAYSACASLLLNDTISSTVNTVGPTPTDTSASLATLSTTHNATSTSTDFVRRGDKWQFRNSWTLTGTKAIPSWPTWGLNQYYGPAKATQNTTIVITVPTVGWPGPPVPTILPRQDNGTLVTTPINISFTETPGTVTSFVPSPTTTTSTITSVSGTTIITTSVSRTTDTETLLPHGSAMANSSSITLAFPSKTSVTATISLQPRDTLTITEYTPAPTTPLSPILTTELTKPGQISRVLRVSSSLESEANSIVSSYASGLSTALETFGTKAAGTLNDAVNGSSSTSGGSLPNLGKLVMTVCVVTGAAMGFGFMLLA